MIVEDETSTVVSRLFDAKIDRFGYIELIRRSDCKADEIYSEPALSAGEGIAATNSSTVSVSGIAWLGVTLL